MILGKKTLFSLLLGFVLLANILELTQFNLLYISTLFSFCTCILLPGFLISLILRIGKISFWENLLLIVGLSIALLEFGGLLLNILLPLFGVNDPLAFQNLVTGFDVYILLLFAFAWLRTKHLEVRLQLPRRSKSEKVLYIMPIFFPILATLGAIVLNNGGSNILTLVLLGTIAFYSLLLVLFRDKVPADLFPYAIFFIGLACLFTTSLRSWYITGHDIEIEYYIFQLTNTYHIWNMAFYQDAFNACLSITILPTILTNLLSLQDMYIYKVIFQILFAIAPVSVFFILRNYTTPVFAFLSAFLFISFPTFFNDMPMLNRQEIGFIFFGLVLYVMLFLFQPQQSHTKPGTSTGLSLAKRKILFIIFALSVIVSHYSTNFVLVALVAFVYVSTLIISLPCVKKTFAWLILKSPIKPKNTFPNKAFLSLPLILLLFLMTYVWNNAYTHSSNHSSSVIGEVVGSILTQSNIKSSDLSYSIFFSPPKESPEQELQDYIQSLKQKVGPRSEKASTNEFYSKSITDKYPAYPLSQEVLPSTPYGKLLYSFDIPVFNGQAELRSLSASFMQIFVFIGLLALLFLKRKQPVDLQYLLLCVGSLFLLATITILPAISLEYGVLRMFQQLLFMISLPIALGINFLSFFMESKRKIIFTGVVIIVFFLNLTGFISHLTGNYSPQMTLDNAGLYYDAYYVHGSDVFAIVWLSKNTVNKVPVVADARSVSLLKTYGHINASDENFPALIPKNAYVYLPVLHRTVVFLGRSTIYYNSDKPFLDRYKNTIYSNGEVNIYK